MAKKQLTVKEAKLVKATIEGKNQTEAGLIADSNRSPESARVWASNTLRKATVQEELQKEMARQGISVEKIIKPIADALVADKVHIVGNGDQAMAEVVPDHSIRLKASGMAQTLLGVKADGGGDTINNFIQLVNEQKNTYGI